MSKSKRALIAAVTAVLVLAFAATLLDKSPPPSRTATAPSVPTEAELVAADVVESTIVSAEARADRADDTAPAAVQASAEARTTQTRSIRVQASGGETVRAAVSGVGELSEDAVLQLLSSDPARDSRFETEPVDPTWAPGMEAAIWSALSAVTDGVMEITAVECRTTVCRAIAPHNDVMQQLDDTERREQFQRSSQLLRESFMPLLNTPDGRLNSLSISGRITEDREETIFSLSGPPLERVDASSP